uniref:Peptidase S1 domain-containing protein n=1 Tax=Stomoxys calcitrans TaxID=35570 RepID=A0A1I8Q1R5_STOCA
MVINSSLTVLVLALVASVSCHPKITGRIVNGTITDIERFPFAVSIRRPDGTHLCGSSIIAPSWLLTAAHCAKGRTASETKVQYGTATIGVQGENIAQVKRIIIHEQYNPSKNFLNDIALLELEEALVYNYKNIAPVTLPKPRFEIHQVPKGAPGVLIGWGYNGTHEETQDTLHSVDLKIYSDNECSRRHEKRTTSHQICAGVDEGWKGQCGGDSGGPLLYSGSIQVGIVSWSTRPCTLPPFPGVFTKVSHYVDWIYKHIN